jgi:hypothetical protein
LDLDEIDFVGEDDFVSSILKAGLLAITDVFGLVYF